MIFCVINLRDFAAGVYQSFQSASHVKGLVLKHVLPVTVALSLVVIVYQAIFKKQ